MATLRVKKVVKSSNSKKHFNLLKTLKSIISINYLKVLLYRFLVCNYICYNLCNTLIIVIFEYQ